MASIVVSYHHAAADLAYALSSRLEDAGFSVVINPDPRAGEMWSPWLDREIGLALAVIALITPEASAAPFVTYEWAVALGAGIDVIPLVVGAADLHPRLKALAPLDFTDPAAQPWPDLLDRVWRVADQRGVVEAEGAPGSVSEAVSMLNAHQGDTRLRAVDLLAGIDHSAARAALVAAAQHPAYGAVRLAAVGALAKVGGADSLAGLLAAIRDADPDVNRAAAQAISAFGDAAVPGLLEIVRSSSPFGSRAAVWALSLIGTPSVVPGLIDALQMGGWFAPRTAAVTLGRIGSAAAVPGLIAALRSEDESLVSLAVKALRQIGTPDALAAVEPFEAAPLRVDRG